MELHLGHAFSCAWSRLFRVDAVGGAMPHFPLYPLPSVSRSHPFVAGLGHRGCLSTWWVYERSVQEQDGLEWARYGVRGQNVIELETRREVSCVGSTPNGKARALSSHRGALNPRAAPLRSPLRHTPL